MGVTGDSSIESQVKEKRLAIGVYSEIRIGRAREVALAARELVRQGRDPTTEKKISTTYKIPSR